MNKVTSYKVTFCILPWHKLSLIFGHQILSIILLSIPLKYSKIKNKSNVVHNNSHSHEMLWFFFPAKWPLSSFLNVSVCPDIYFAQVTKLNFHWHYLLNTIRSKLASIIPSPLLQADDTGRTGSAQASTLVTPDAVVWDVPWGSHWTRVRGRHGNQATSTAEMQEVAFVFNWTFLMLRGGTPKQSVPEAGLNQLQPVPTGTLLGPRICHFLQGLCLNPWVERSKEKRLKKW